MKLKNNIVESYMEERIEVLLRLAFFAVINYSLM